MSTYRNQPKSISSFYTGRLHTLHTQQQLSNKLLNLFRSTLPAGIAHHIHAVSTVNNTLYVYNDSASLATKLRFLEPDAITTFNSLAGLNIQSIKYRLHRPMPSQSQRTPKLQPKICLSAKSSQLLIDTAATINDPSLKQSLLKLANHRPKPAN